MPAKENVNPRSLSHEIPDIDLRHFHVLTDDTGILQHARYAIPNREHGYCVDDNARALVVASLHYAVTGETSTARNAAVYLAFLQHALNPASGRFRNFMSFDRQWLEEEGSEDAHGRAIWGLGVAARSAPFESYRKLAAILLREALPAAARLDSPRACSFVLLGLDPYLDAVCVDTAASAILEKFAVTTAARFNANSSDGWKWCEDVLAYSNAKIAGGLIVAGRRLKDASILDTGLAALEWLFSQHLRTDSHVSLIGNDGWQSRDGSRADYDQQPVDAMALTIALTEAYRSTSDRMWLNRAHMAVEWFTGRNDIGLPLYDAETGGCRDGLIPHGINQNQGAESTLSWLISSLILRRAERGFGSGAVSSEGLSWPAVN